MAPVMWLVLVISPILFGFMQEDNEKQGLTDLQT